MNELALGLPALINDILDMSRIESGRMELRENSFSLREFLAQINVIVGGQCEDKGLRYECSVIGTPGESFVGDDLKLKQVLINILGNSVKFTEPPGSVLFSVEQIEPHDGDCALRFTVSDTGIGMDKAFLTKHFDAVLMDMRMPVMDGLEATREIRKLDRTDAKTVPIVALTANAFEEDVQHCLQAGMNAHLSKPVDFDTLKLTLGRLIAEKKED